MTLLTPRQFVGALGTGLAFLVSAELTARVDDYVHFGVPFANVPDLTNDLILHDSLGTRGMPNGRYQRWMLNSAGFRSPESVLTPVPGCIRVMTLGASESFGAADETPNREYPAQLSDSLAKHGCFQVMNAAIVGVAIPGLIQLWNRWASRFQPGIVVILANPQFYLADKQPAFAVPPAVPWHPPSRWWVPRLLSKAQQAFDFPDMIQRRRVQRRLSQLTSGHLPEWFFRSIPRDRLAQYRQDLDSLITTIRAHGAQPILAAYPIRFGDTIVPEDRPMVEAWRQFSPRATTEVMLAFPTEAAIAVRQLGLDRQVAVVDLPRAMNGRRDLFGDPVHYTDAGAAVVASHVQQAVIDLVAHRGLEARLMH
jgi:lysophospholipase L1-like esterase